MSIKNPKALVKERVYKTHTTYELVTDFTGFGWIDFAKVSVECIDGSTEYWHFFSSIEEANGFLNANSPEGFKRCMGLFLQSFNLAENTDMKVYSPLYGLKTRKLSQIIDEMSQESSLKKTSIYDAVYRSKGNRVQLGEIFGEYVNF